MEDNVTPDRRTPSYSGNGGGNCVEVRAGSLVMVRDTKDRGGGTLAFTADARQAFTRSLG